MSVLATIPQPLDLEKLAQLLRLMPLHHIAILIRDSWPRPYFGAVPYIEAMHALTDINSNYGLDDGRDIVSRFLANANTYRGPIAKAVKAELKTRLKGPAAPAWAR